MESQRLSTEEILNAEFNELWQHIKRENSDTFIQNALRVDQSALCLSGGGIRSACFCLGVLQALAKKRLLTQFQYLSTVSGGGYIGSWLTRWIADEGGDATKVESILSESVSQRIEQINSLRENSNYLTPKLGLLSGDFGAALALSIRNILLNWLVFIPVIFLAATLPQTYSSILSHFSQCGISEFGSPKYLTLRNFVYYGTYCPDLATVYVISIASLFVTTYFSCRFLPTHKVKSLCHRQVISFVVIPSVIWSFSISAVAASGISSHFLKYILFWSTFLIPVIAFAVAGVKAEQSDRALFLNNFWTWVAISFVMACALTFGMLLPTSAGHWRLPILAVCGPLFASWMQTFFSALYIGFRNAPDKDEADREWLGRANALKATIPQLWLPVSLAAILLPYLLTATTSHLSSWSFAWVIGTLSAVMVVFGFFAIVGGKSDKTHSEHEISAQKRQTYLDMFVTTTTAIFCVCLITFFAVIENFFAERILTAIAKTIGPTLTEYSFAPENADINFSHFLTLLPPEAAGTLLTAHVCLGIIFLTWAYIAATNINVNRFSLHGLYRNRLIRGYLGSARKKTTRTPDPFTGFDVEDNRRMHELESYETSTLEKKRVLFPVINLSLNLVGGDNLAWQERKASSFVITPHICGSSALGDRLRVSDPTPAGAYITSKLYGGSEPGLGFLGKGISLGTAMTISGAAATPSMGYHTSPVTSFLMTLFNVRLGAWLPNPAVANDEDLRRAGPENALRPLFAEMFGLTNDKEKNVYLSDGGHFENLGLYEMIRRRCRYIFVVDAGQDRNSRFEDLGNAVRKILIDFGATIDFMPSLAEPRSNQGKKKGFAVAKIQYPEKAQCGWLIYLKPVVSDQNLPADIISYSAIHTDFPHESTANQWFTESQFESYRRLGYLLCSQISGDGPANLKEFFSSAVNGNLEPSAGESHSPTSNSTAGCSPDNIHGGC